MTRGGRRQTQRSSVLLQVYCALRWECGRSLLTGNLGPGTAGCHGEILITLKSLFSNGVWIEGVDGVLKVWRSTIWYGVEAEKRDGRVAEHFRLCTTLFPSYPSGLKLVLTLHEEVK